MRMNKEEMLSIDDLPRKMVDVSEWWPRKDGQPNEIEIKAWGADDFIEYSKLIDEKSKNTSVLEEYLYRSIVDENGNKCFTRDEMKVLLKKNYRALDKIFNEAVKLNECSMAKLEEKAKN